MKWNLANLSFDFFIFIDEPFQSVLFIFRQLGFGDRLRFRRGWNSPAMKHLKKRQAFNLNSLAYLILQVP